MPESEVLRVLDYPAYFDMLERPLPANADGILAALVDDRLIRHCDGIEPSRIETLATCAWIREHETVLVSGPPGVGKTHLAVSLGVKAIENRFSVAFYRLDDLLHAMKQDADAPPRRLRGKKYMNVSLLVVDEVGFQPMSRQEASLFFRLVSYRYQRGSTLITTNKSVKDWPEILGGDEVMATALLDRLLHRCHVLNIKGRSYRLQDLERMLK